MYSYIPPSASEVHQIEVCRQVWSFSLLWAQWVWACELAPVVHHWIFLLDTDANQALSDSVPDHPGLWKDKNAVDQTNLMSEVYSHDLHWCELSQHDASICEWVSQEKAFSQLS